MMVGMNITNQKIPITMLGMHFSWLRAYLDPQDTNWITRAAYTRLGDAYLEHLDAEAGRSRIQGHPLLYSEFQDQAKLHKTLSQKHLPPPRNKQNTTQQQKHPNIHYYMTWIYTSWATIQWILSKHISPRDSDVHYKLRVTEFIPSENQNYT